MEPRARETKGEHVFVVGAGQAAVQAIEVASQRGHEGTITLISEEKFLPYRRPPS